MDVEILSILFCSCFTLFIFRNSFLILGEDGFFFFFLDGLGADGWCECLTLI